MLCFLLDCQSAKQTWHYGPEPGLHSQPGRGWEPGGRCSEIPCSQLCNLGRQDSHLRCRVPHTGLSIPNLPAALQSCQKLKEAHFHFSLCAFGEWIPDEAGSGGAAMTTACAQLPPHQPQLYLTPPSQGGKSRSMTPLSALISTFLYNFSKAKTLLNLFYCMLSMISGGSVLSNTLARKNKR